MINSKNPQKRNDLIFDVGLHQGEDTEFYLKKGFFVVAFEANPDLVALCTQKFARYIEEGRLKIVHGAIVDPETCAGRRTISFYRNDADSVWGTVNAGWAERNEKSGNSSTVIEVPVVNFTQILKEHGVPHYMKVDIEGCDTICVKALQSFRERPNYISIESDKNSFRAIREEIDLLSSLGYQNFQAVEQSAVPSQAPPLQAREGHYAPHSFASGASGLFGAELPKNWMSREEVLKLYRYIRAGYYLLGDDGVLNRGFRGAGRLRSLTRKFLKRATGEAVPGWYDTHARLNGAGTSAPIRDS